MARKHKGIGKTRLERIVQTNMTEKEVLEEKVYVKTFHYFLLKAPIIFERS